MKEPFHVRLQKCLDFRGMTAAELSRRSGLSQALISQYLNNKFDPKNDKITILADVLDVNELYLAGFEDNMEKLDQNKYGNHQDNLEYFADKPEILEMYKQIYESDNLTLLFDTARELKPKELEKVLKYMKLVMEEEL